MNITAVLVIAFMVIGFLVIEICGVSLLIYSIREKDWTLSCVLGFTLIMVCLLEILAFITICPELKQDIYTDCQVEQKVVETKETDGWLLASNISADANFEDFKEMMEK